MPVDQQPGERFARDIEQKIILNGLISTLLELRRYGTEIYNGKKITGFETIGIQWIFYILREIYKKCEDQEYCATLRLSQSVAKKITHDTQNYLAVMTGKECFLINNLPTSTSSTATNQSTKKTMGRDRDERRRKAMLNKAIENDRSRRKINIAEMKIFVLGAGNALSRTYDNSSFLFSLKTNKNEEEVNYLFDCGTTVPKIWHRHYRSVPIHGIFITHDHFDHCGGLDEIIFHHYFTNNKPMPIYVGNKEVQTRIWDRIKSNILSVGEEKDLVQFHVNDAPDEFSDFMWIKTLHVSEKYPSFGLALKTNNNFCTYISGDTQFNPTRFNLTADIYIKTKLNRRPDIILHETTTSDVKHQTHSSYLLMRDKITSHTKEKMLLYHYDEHDTESVIPEKDGFIGFIPNSSENEIVFYKNNSATIKTHNSTKVIQLKNSALTMPLNKDMNNNVENFFTKIVTT